MKHLAYILIVFGAFAACLVRAQDTNTDISSGNTTNSTLLRGQNESCSSNEECQEQYYCLKRRFARDICVPRLVNGQKCSSNRECASNICDGISNICTIRKRQLNEACRNSTDCASEYYCSFTVPVEVGEKTVVNGTGASIESTNSTTFVLDAKGNGLCLFKLHFGDRCSFSEQCNEGLTCIANICVFDPIPSDSPKLNAWAVIALVLAAAFFACVVVPTIVCFVFGYGCFKGCCGRRKDSAYPETSFTMSSNGNAQRVNL